MGKKKDKKSPPLERGLLDAMRSLDRQIEREMQRSPSERDVHGVQKWEPYRKRIERICTFSLNALGDEEVSLDAILVLAQSYAKTLALVVEDLEEEGLGNIRSSYCLEAARMINHDMRRIESLLRGAEEETVN